jgi:hypothetical protein
VHIGYRQQYFSLCIYERSGISCLFLHGGEKLICEGVLTCSCAVNWVGSGEVFGFEIRGLLLRVVFSTEVI